VFSRTNARRDLNGAFRTRVYLALIKGAMNRTVVRGVCASGEVVTRTFMRIHDPAGEDEQGGSAS